MPQTLLEPEFEAAYNNWKSNPSPESNAAFLEAVDPVINKEMFRFNPDERPMLKPHAKTILLESMKNYDPQRSSMRTFASMYLQRLNRVSNKQNSIFKMPESQVYMQRRITDAVQEMTDDLGRPPTTAEISENLHLPPKKIEQYMGRKQTMNSSFLSRNDEFGGEDNATDMGVVSPVDLQTRVDLIYPDLNPYQQLILEHSLGLWGKRRLSAGQIAKKLKRSDSFVSSEKAKIQNMLDTAAAMLR